MEKLGSIPKNMEEIKSKQTLEILESDDEFDDFEQEDWTSQMTDQDDLKMWKEEWTENEPDDEFTKRLKEELAKSSKP